MYTSIPWNEIHVSRFLVIGASLSLVESAVLYPVDVVRARLQCDTRPARGQIQAIVDCLKNTFRREGARALYQGFWWDSVLSLPSNLAYIVSYNELKEVGTRYSESKHPLFQKTVIPLIAGAGAEFACAVVDNPVDVIVQRLQIANRSGSGRPSGYRLIKKIHREEGLKGFYRGFTSSLATNIPSSALWWPSYEVSKYLLAPVFFRTERTKSREHSLHATAGFLAGLSATVLTNPLDVAKTRVQTRSETYGTNNPFRIIPRIIQREGIWSLEKGLVPRLVYNLPASALAAFSYELALGWSRKKKQDAE